MEDRNLTDPAEYTEQAKVLDGLRREIQQLLRDRDVVRAREVEVCISEDGSSLWINVDGKCHLRVGNIWGGIVIKDMRGHQAGI